jgi:hypothetical protein
MAQDGPQDTAEALVLPAVGAGTTILANKKSPLNRLESAKISHLAKRTLQRWLFDVLCEK